MENEGKNTEVAAAGDENEDMDTTGAMGVTSATGATEESSTSTTGEDGAVKENDGLIVEADEIAEEEGKNAEAAAEDEENKSLGATGATGATEEDSNSTIGEDGAQNEDDGLILEEREIMEDGGKNMDAAVASDECGEDSRAIEEDTKSSGAPRSIPRTRRRTTALSQKKGK